MQIQSREMPRVLLVKINSKEEDPKFGRFNLKERGNLEIWLVQISNEDTDPEFG